jgi:predicted O-methyltransferase YrrM
MTMENKTKKENITGGKEEPWYTRESINLLETMLKPDFICYEWGSGNSTIWIARRVKHLTSMETKGKWFRWASRRMDELKIGNVSLQQEEQPAHIEHIKTFPDEHFDAIFVDGRDRNRCIENSIEKLKSGGFLLLDNSERDRYAVSRELLKEWEKKETYNGRWKTTIWIKP